MVEPSADTPMNEPIARVRIELQEIEPKVWRRVDVPLSSTLLALHEFIQFAFRWTDSHLFEFEIGDRRYGQPEYDRYAMTGSVREACCAAQVRRRAVEHIGVQVGENLDERGRGRGGEAPQTGAVERPQGTKLMLGQRLGELADCGRTVVSGKLRGDRDGQDERLYKAASIRLKTVVDHGIEQFLYVYDFGDNWRHDCSSSRRSGRASPTSTTRYLSRASGGVLPRMSGASPASWSFSKRAGSRKPAPRGARGDGALVRQEYLTRRHLLAGVPSTA